MAIYTNTSVSPPLRILLRSPSSGGFLNPLILVRASDVRTKEIRELKGSEKERKKLIHFPTPPAASPPPVSSPMPAPPAPALPTPRPHWPHPPHPRPTDIRSREKLEHRLTTTLVGEQLRDTGTVLAPNLSVS